MRRISHPIKGAQFISHGIIFGPIFASGPRINLGPAEHIPRKFDDMSRFEVEFLRGILRNTPFLIQ